MNTYVNSKIITKLIDNINFSQKKGMIIASPSVYPPYKFHWVRDAALVMRVIIDLYERTRNVDYLVLIFNYLENEMSIQLLPTISGIGEPKVNIDGTSFNDSWGRPQNDGPALRGILLFQIYDLLKDEYPNLINRLVVPMIKIDINYIIENLNYPCYDLWEEIVGWHFYTRLVQAKFMKTYLEHSNINNNKTFNKNINEIYKNFLSNLKDHIDGEHIISSFDIDGDIIRRTDASILLGYCHINYDEDLLKLFSLRMAKNMGDILLGDFRRKYNLNDLNMIGRYKEDVYFNGHTWIICSLGLAQVYYKLSENDEFIDLKEFSKDIFNYIISIDTNFDLAEQYNPITKEQISARKLTWNYAELYMINKLMLKN